MKMGCTLCELMQKQNTGQLNASAMPLFERVIVLPAKLLSLHGNFTIMIFSTTFEELRFSEATTHCERRPQLLSTYAAIHNCHNGASLLLRRCRKLAMTYVLIQQTSSNETIVVNSFLQ